jgi:hypothetical protein
VVAIKKDKIAALIKFFIIRCLSVSQSNSNLMPQYRIN